MQIHHAPANAVAIAPALDFLLFLSERVERFAVTVQRTLHVALPVQRLRQNQLHQRILRSLLCQLARQVGSVGQTAQRLIGKHEAQTHAAIVGTGLDRFLQSVGSRRCLVEADQCFTQQSVREEMNRMNDEKLAKLVSVGGWVRGTEVLSSLVAKRYSADGAELMHQPDLVDLVTRALQTWDTDPQSLILEVTETSMMVNHEISQQNLQKLSESGVMLSIDDFGTGYSSYSYLQQLPVQEMKIDQSFVRGILSNSNSERLIRSMINLGHDMGINVLVEGIETPEEMAHLRELGCVYGQGYLIGKPMPLDEMLDWIENSEWE